MLAQQRGSSGAHVALSGGVTIAILHEDNRMALAGTTLSALRAAGHARSRGIASDVLILDNASGDDALRLARQIEALYYADGVALLAFARRQTPADIRNNAL